MDLLIHPLLEALTDHCVDQVGQIGSGQLVNLPCLQWQVLAKYGVLLGVVKHAVEGQAIKVRHLNGLDLSSFDMLTLTCSDVSEVEDADTGVSRQVDATFEGQETVYLVLGPVFGVELCRRDNLVLSGLL